MLPIDCYFNTDICIYQEVSTYDCGVDKKECILVYEGQAMKCCSSAERSVSSCGPQLTSNEETYFQISPDADIDKCKEFILEDKACGDKYRVEDVMKITMPFTGDFSIKVKVESI